MSGVISIVSIDIGLRTLSIYKEYFDYDTAKSIKKPTQLYNKLGEAHDEMKEYVLKVAACGQAVFLEKKDLGERKDYYSGKALLNLIDFFDDLEKKDVFRDVDVIIMEKQLNKNPMATVLMHHIYSWCLIQYRQFKKVLLYPSKNKTRVLGAPLKEVDERGKASRVDKAFRKKWSTQKTLEILTVRGDNDTIQYIFKDNKSKKDDLSDTITQCLSYHLLKLLKKV
jgi:hypothetical protein